MYLISIYTHQKEEDIAQWWQSAVAAQYDREAMLSTPTRHQNIYCSVSYVGARMELFVMPSQQM